MNLDFSSDNRIDRLIQQDIEYMSYEYMGCHKKNTEYYFRVWAPVADSVFLVGDFCGWRQGIAMKKTTENGIWEVAIPETEASVGDKYKYKVYGKGEVHYKSDPYAFWSESLPNTASIIYDEAYQWKDIGWIQFRKSIGSSLDRYPINIYELDLGSWKHHEDGSVYSYRDIATELAPYIKQMGYTHIEIMPIAEGYFDSNCKYQISSFFAPSSKFGTPADFKAFVDAMHEAGIGVILKWIPAYFSSGEHGLCNFDGDALYELSGTRIFDLARNEVVSFLSSNAIYWIREYHIDGLNVCEIDPLLSCQKNDVSTNQVRSEAILFLKQLNSYIHSEFDSVWMISEEISFGDEIEKIKSENLGFDISWNNAWAEDVCSYACEDPIFRRHHHEKMTFSLACNLNENSILPFSHKSVVGGKKSFLDKMNGDYWQKFAGTRAFLGYMMTHPGKKLTFMGGEIGQFREWNPQNATEWFLLDYDSHAKLQLYVSELNSLYLSSPHLWEKGSKFVWIDSNNRNQSILSYRRRDAHGRELIVLINFTPVVHEDFLLGVPWSGIYEEIFNSDDVRFGGSGVLNIGEIKTERKAANFFNYSVKLRVPPLGITILKCKRKNSKL